jgi:glyoxylase-like metal-dependent hydrolase (beta-lactamase superfamily II)
MRRPTLLVATAALLVSGSVIAHLRAQGKPMPVVDRPAAIQPLKPDLYMIAGTGGNVAAYVTSEGVVLIDDMYERNYKEIVEQVRTVTQQPIRYVLNTHHHDDHAGGNAGAVADRITVVAHDNVRSNMIRIKQPGMPSITYSLDTKVHIGGKEVRAAFHGRGHTNGDAVIHFPAERVVHTGDLFLARRPGAPGFTPYFDYAAGGSMLEWVTVMDRMLALDFDTVIPGHGAVSTRADVEKWRADLVAMRDRLQGMIRKGASRAEVERVLIDDYRWPAGGLALGQLDALIAELRR